MFPHARRKRLLAITAIASAAALTAACGGGDANPSPAPGDGGDTPAAIAGDLTIMTWRTDLLEDGTLDGYAAEFKKLYPDVNIEFQGFTDYEGEITTLMSTEDYGDVLAIPGAPLTPDKFGDYFEPLGTVDEIEQTYRFVRDKAYDGLAYGIPVVGNTQGNVYNKDGWEAAGNTDYATTSAEFVQALQNIKDNTEAIPLYTNYFADWPITQWEGHRGEISANPDYVNSLLETDAPWAEGTDHNVIDTLIWDIVSAGLIEEDPTTTDWESSKGMIARGVNDPLAVAGLEQADLGSTVDGVELALGARRGRVLLEEHDTGGIEVGQVVREAAVLQRRDAALGVGEAGVVHEPLDPGPGSFLGVGVHVDAKVVVAADRRVELAVDLCRERHVADDVAAHALGLSSVLHLADGPRTENHGADLAARDHALRGLPVRRRRVGLDQTGRDDVPDQGVDHVVVGALGPRGVGLEQGVDVVGVGRDLAAVAFPLGDRPVGEVVRVQRDRFGVVLDVLQGLDELRRGGRVVGVPGRFPDVLVVDDALGVADHRDAVGQAVIGLVPDEAVGLLDLVDGAQRLEVVTELVGGQRCAGDREHVAVVLGAHQGGDLTLVVGEALELDVDVRVQLLELSGVPVKGAVLEEVGAPGHDGEVAGDRCGGVPAIAGGGAGVSVPAAACGGQGGSRGDRSDREQPLASCVREHRRSSLGPTVGRRVGRVPAQRQRRRCAA